MRDFNGYLEAELRQWRARQRLPSQWGSQNGVEREWILPEEHWIEGLWPGIRESLPAYLEAEGIQRHRGSHNLKSSWTLCANLYFPFRGETGLPILAGFLNERVAEQIKGVDGVELEYAEKPPLDPQHLLGEPTDGRRGANQTSPDVAFLVRTAGGPGLVLTENKLAEHSFYSCSGRAGDEGNPDPTACLDCKRILRNPKGECWQMRWSKGPRAYWEHLRVSSHGERTLTQCPAATAGYQLFRQQALAEGIAASTRYTFVASCVAYDARNERLVRSLRSTGVDDFATGWGALFEGRVRFRAWTHQQWVSWVRAHDPEGIWRGWSSYVEARYGYQAEPR